MNTDEFTDLVEKGNEEANKSVRVEIYFASDKNKEEAKHIKNALRYFNGEEHKNLTVALINFWLKGSDEEVAAIFGDYSIKWRFDKRTMLTVTGSGNQLRVWYAFPKRITFDHVDSCGGCLILEIIGHRETINEYLYAVLKKTNFSEFHGSMGCRLYIL